MTTYAWLANRDLEPVRDGVEIRFNEDFEDLVERAKDFGSAVCIAWARTEDGEGAFWGPSGVTLVPHWYNMGRPALGADKLVVMPVRVTEAQRVKFRGLPDGPARLRAWLDRIK